MEDATDRLLVNTVIEQIASLVQSYGGILWGEHGKGFRSEFGPSVFGNEIWEQMCVIKHAFDPNNQFNPGKIASPEVGGPLLSIQSKTRGKFDESISVLQILSNSNDVMVIASVSHLHSIAPCVQRTEQLETQFIALVKSKSYSTLVTTCR